jgi:hypothetical protein
MKRKWLLLEETGYKGQGTIGDRCIGIVPSFTKPFHLIAEAKGK